MVCLNGTIPPAGIWEVAKTTVHWAVCWLWGGCHISFCAQTVKLQHGFRPLANHVSLRCCSANHTLTPALYLTQTRDRIGSFHPPLWKETKGVIPKMLKLFPWTIKISIQFIQPNQLDCAVIRKPALSVPSLFLYGCESSTSSVLMLLLCCTRPIKCSQHKHTHTPFCLHPSVRDIMFSFRPALPVLQTHQEHCAELKFASAFIRIHG